MLPGLRAPEFAMPYRAPLASLALLFSAGSAAAQITPPAFDFDVDTPASAFTWSGTTSLGPLQGNPGNSFNLQGEQAIVLSGGFSQAIAQGRFATGGATSVVGSIQAIVPNPVPFLPALAQLSIDNLSFELSTGTFPVDAVGNFATTGDLLILSGTITVTPLIGAATQSDLTGMLSTNQPVSGTLLQSGLDLTATSVQNSMIAFTDPASGVMASINLMGTLVARHTCAAPSVYCTSNANSTGQVAALSATGSTRLQDLSTVLGLVLGVDQLPSGSAGFFVFSDTPDVVANPAGSQGDLCLGGFIYRLSNFVQVSGAGGSVALAYPVMGSPVMLAPGQAWHFQYWYRDAVAGMPVSNFSDAVRVVFCP